jgi:hypothetical protein
MAETIRYMKDVISRFPDNTSGIITAEAMRDFIISIHDGGGALTSSDTVSIPIDADTPVAINPLVTNPEKLGVFWLFDGNNFAASNYAAALPSATIPSPFYKVAKLTVQMELNKSLGGSDPYDFYLTKNGAAIGLPIRVRYDSSEAKHVFLAWDVYADISTSDTYGVQVTGIGTNDDLEMTYFRMLVTDSASWEEPT